MTKSPLTIPRYVVTLRSINCPFDYSLLHCLVTTHCHGVLTIFVVLIPLLPIILSLDNSLLYCRLYYSVILSLDLSLSSCTLSITYIVPFSAPCFKCSFVPLDLIGLVIEKILRQRIQQGRPFYVNQSVYTLASVTKLAAKLSYC